jgi:hypothetical protein
MHGRSTRAALPLLAALMLSWPMQAQSTTIVLSADEHALRACSSIAHGTSAFLYLWAQRETGPGTPVAGVSFRLEVTDPDGWTVLYAPPTGSTLLGRVVDRHPGPDDEEVGATVLLPQCVEWDTEGRVQLGRVFVFNEAGASTELHIRPALGALENERPTLLYGCDAIGRYQLAVGSLLASGCDTFAPPGGHPDVLCAEQPSFIHAINREPDPRWTTPARQKDPYREVLAMLKRRSLVEFPGNLYDAPLDQVTIHSAGLRAALDRHDVTFVSKSFPCFDLADTLGVVRNGGVVRLTDWSRFFTFTVPSPTDVGQLIDDLASVGDVVFAESNGFGVTPAHTTVSFSVPNPIIDTGLVRIRTTAPLRGRVSIYDVRGRLVRHLFDGELQQGLNELPWDGRDQSGRTVPRGAYYVRIEAGTQQATRKIVYLR